MTLNLTHYFKLAFISLLLLLVPSQTQAQTTFTEGFENTTFLPTGWTSVGTTTLWSRRTTGTFPTCTPQGGAGMVRFSSRQQVAGTNQTIITPAIDYSNIGSNTAYFSFWIFRDNGSVNGDSISLYINTNNSLTGATHFGTVARYTKMSVPDTVANNGWYKYTFNVPSGFTSNTNYILIRGFSQNGNNIYLDEMQWNAFPNLCTGKPSPGTITASPATICNNGGNSTLSLSGQTTGVSGISFQWKSSASVNGPWTNVGINNSSLNTGNINSTTYFKCVTSCSYSGLSDSTTIVPVVVKPNPYPTVTVTPGNASYCAGSTGAKLVANGATSYTWTPITNLSSSTSDTVYASPTTTTTYTVRGMDTAGCVAQATASVTLRQSPVVTIISPDTNMCFTDSVQLTAQTGGGGNTYAWAPAGRAAASIFAKPLSTTKYTVTVTNGFGCKGYASRTVNVQQAPKAKFEVNIVNRTYYFIDSSSNAQSVYYDFGDGNSSTNRNPTYTYSFTGPKTIMMVAYNAPCGNDTFYRSFNVSAIVGTASKSFRFFPNPVNNELQIELFDNNETIVQICDMSGKVLQSKTAENGNALTVDVSELSAGMYMIKHNNTVQLFSKQ